MRWLCGTDGSEWLTTITVEPFAVGPLQRLLPASLSGGAEAFDRAEWIAVATHGQLWALEPSLLEPGRLLGPTSTAVAHLNPNWMWIDQSDRTSSSGDLLAVDANGAVQDRVRLGADITLVRHLDTGLLVSTSRGIELHGVGTVFEGDPEWVAAGSDHVALLDLQTTIIEIDGGGIVHVDLADLGFADLYVLMESVSPDGTKIALSGSLRPRTRQDHKRPSKVAIIDLAVGTAAILDPEFDNFASIAWSSDSIHLLFGPPFEPGQLYLADIATGKTEVLTQFGQPLAPLLDLTPVQR